MKYFKIIILLLISFIFSGCSVNYNLYIDDEKFVENFGVIAEENEQYSKDDYMYKFNEEYPIYIDQEYKYYNPYEKDNDFTYYNKSYRESNNGYIFNYDTEYSYKNLNRSRVLNTAFENFSFNYNSQEQYFYFSCNDFILNQDNNFSSIKVTISFSENIDVISTNADTFENQKYCWNFSDNVNDNIQLQYKIKKVDNTTPKKNDSSDNSDQENSLSTLVNNNIGIVLFLSILSLIVVIYLIIKIKIIFSVKR
ncbi:hypothetical protein EGR52_02465 [bacterium]|nr:hypothetical protein [bacterium]